MNDGSCVRIRPQHANHVWAYDFVADRTHDGRAFRMLTVIDECTRECLAIVVDRRLRSTNVIETLAELFIRKGLPEHIRSDNVLTTKSSLPWKQREHRRLLLFNEAPPCTSQLVPLWSSTCGVIPSYHNDTGSAASRPLLYFKQTGFPVEGPSIIYEVLTALSSVRRQCESG